MKWFKFVFALNGKFESINTNECDEGFLEII